jgi:mycofactocin system creatininase family protein
MDGIPVDLRRGLYAILLEHAEGALTRKGRLWVPLEHLLDQPELHGPYRFERPGPGLQPEVARQVGSAYRLGELTWPEAEQRLSEVDIALLPVGAIEQHGPHLPLDTDTYDACYLAEKVAERCSDPRPLVLPVLPYGVSYHHDDFPGTISISNDSLSRMIYEIGLSCARIGVTKLVIVNGHGGNTPTLQLAAQMINRDAHIFTCVDTGETSDVDVAEICVTPNDVHAGEIETSTGLATRPHLVKLERAQPMVPEFSSRYLDFTARRSVEWYARTARISTSGVLGDPTQASAEKGRRLWEIMITNLVELVEELKGMTLDEIYERRY